MEDNMNLEANVSNLSSSTSHSGKTYKSQVQLTSEHELEVLMFAILLLQFAIIFLFTRTGLYRWIKYKFLLKYRTLFSGIPNTES